jgi:hypothetical protein
LKADNLPVNTLNELGLDDLRAERHRLSEEVARLAWLRRLVAARCDLEVARLVGMAPLPGELPDDVRDALTLRSSSLTPETLQRLADAVRALGRSTDDTQQRLDEATRKLVERYTEDPAGCLPARRRVARR